MAIVTVTILEGRSQEQLDRLHRALAEAVIRELGAKPHQVRTVIHQVRAGEYAVGGEPLVALTVGRVSDGPPNPGTSA